MYIEVIINKKKIVVSNIYRSPSFAAENVNSFIDKFDHFLSKLNKQDCPYILFLDSNVNLLKTNSCNLAQTYMETLHNNGFLQLVSKATRIQGTHFSLIDHICIKKRTSHLKDWDNYIRFVRPYYKFYSFSC